VTVEIALSILAGIGLSAAAGFRIFVPLLATCLAARFDWIELAGGFAWLGTDTALIVLAVATVIEILAYYVPWVDNALDTIATPTAVVAGVMLTASVITDLPPLARWTLAIVAGGGAASIFQGLTAGTRTLSSFSTAGLANPVVATAELGAAVALAVLALLVPVAAFVAVVVLAWWAMKRLLFRRRRPA
jgi:hypothetical protein